MMPPVNNPLAGKDQTQSSTTRKTLCPARPQYAAVKCPRCESPNTKFCYYNNYSLTQPRHFCKTCRRYWTNGGALRNVPIGGGCRKNKKLKSSHIRSGDSTDSSGSSDVGGLKFFQGISPAMDFQLGWINTPRLHPFNQFSSFGDLSANSAGISANPCFNLESSLMGFGCPLSSSLKQGEHVHVINTSIGFQEMGSMNIHNNLASSIEDMHWKLQQRRSAVEDNQKENSTIPSGNIEHLIQKPHQIPFHQLENSKAESCLIGISRKDDPVGNLPTELFANAAVAPAQAPTSSSNNLNDNTSNWSGIQAWTELTQYSSLP